MLVLRTFFLLFAFINCYSFPVCTANDNLNQACEVIEHPKIKKSKKTYTYNLTICAIFRDEGPYLKEWIEFHKLVGVQHFLLYNHLSVDNSREVLQPYIDDKTVEVIDLNDEIKSRPHWGSIQMGSYNDGLKRLLGKSKWVAFIDSDEFLIPVKQDNLLTVLKDYEKFGGICAHWVMFGTSHIQKIPDNVLQIEALVYRSKLDCSTNSHVKSIVRPEKVVEFTNPHFAIYKKGSTQVNENKVAFNGALEKEFTANILRINHYWTRDEDYFFNVKVPSRVKRGFSKEKELTRAEMFNEVLDTDMFRFVPALRAKMGYDINN
jgi:hypothetical protein